ncbi:MAG: TIGR02300 family protein [Hellea sp.]|nr:TIGR02300 family protein [Hellea sp.]
MAKKAELGEKRICPECGAKFYDLTRNPATCPMCQHSFDPAELEPQEIAPLAPESEDEEAPVADEEDIDEEEEAAKELELDGDDVAVIGGSSGHDDKPEFDGFSTDEDEDEDAALVDDDDDNVLPPPDDSDDDDDVEEVEI